MILYHYTSPLHLSFILADGFLETTESNMHGKIEHYGPNVVWLTTDPAIESGSNGLIKINPTDPDKTEIRFTLDVPDHMVRRWMSWADAQGMDMRWRYAMIETAGGVDVVTNWWVAFRRIQESMWKAVDRRPEGGWA